MNAQRRQESDSRSPSPAQESKPVNGGNSQAGVLASKQKHFGFCVSQQAVLISNRRAQQGAQADAGYSTSCFLVSCARRGLACR